MKITTWNVNSLTARLQHVLDWLAANPVDVLALQELKLTDDKFPLEALREVGYEAAVFGQKTYNGVALLSRTPLTEVGRNIVGFTDENSRVIAGTVDAPGGPVRIVNGYFVNGQAPGTDKFEYKMSWLRALRDWLREELAAHPRLVLLGDFNIAPDDRDVFDPKVWNDDHILTSTAERAALQRLYALGLHDAFRLHSDEANVYSWWDYRMGGLRRNLGLRIDLTLVSDALRDRAAESGIDKDPRTWERPSDHAPAWVRLA